MKIDNLKVYYLLLIVCNLTSIKKKKNLVIWLWSTSILYMQWLFKSANNLFKFQTRYYYEGTILPCRIKHDIFCLIIKNIKTIILRSMHKGISPISFIRTCLYDEFIMHIHFILFLYFLQRFVQSTNIICERSHGNALTQFLSCKYKKIITGYARRVCGFPREEWFKDMAPNNLNDLISWFFFYFLPIPLYFLI